MPKNFLFSLALFALVLLLCSTNEVMAGTRKRDRRYAGGSTSELGPSTPPEQEVSVLNDENYLDDDDEGTEERAYSDTESGKTGLSSNRASRTLYSVSSPRTRLRRRLGFGEQQLPDCPSEEVQMKMRDFDPLKREWAYSNGTKQFTSYCEAFDFVQTEKLEFLRVERSLNLISYLEPFSDIESKESYETPKGGVNLVTPFPFGVVFNSMELKWQSFIKTSTGMLRTIGLFSNSRVAAAFVDIFISRVSQLGFYPPNMALNHIPAKDLDKLDMEEIQEAFADIKHGRFSSSHN